VILSGRRRDTFHLFLFPQLGPEIDILEIEELWNALRTRSRSVPRPKTPSGAGKPPQLLFHGLAARAHDNRSS
jgi:hypothetical protein